MHKMPKEKEIGSIVVCMGSLALAVFGFQILAATCVVIGTWIVWRK